MGHGKKEIGSTVFSASNTGTWFGCGYKTPMELFEQYNGKPREEPSEEAKKSMAFGTFFEDSVARWYAEKNGVKLRRCGDTAYWSDDMPYFICHPDRLVIGKDAEGQRIALEIKCVAPFAEGWGPEGTEEIPDVYYFQVQSYYACNVPCDLVKVVCMRGNRIYIYDILRDDDVVAEIRKRVAKAYADFSAGIAPEPQSFEEASRFYSSRVNKDAEGVGANDEILGLYDRLIKIHYEEGKLKAEEDSIKKSMVTALDEAPAFLSTEDGKVKRIAWWTSVSRTSLDTDALQKDHPEINLEDYKRVSQSSSFRISYPRESK